MLEESHPQDVETASTVEEGETTPISSYQTPPRVNTPPPVHKSSSYIPERTTLSDAWQSRCRNPVTYALGLMNTVTDMVEQHVHFIESPEETPPTQPDEESSIKPSPVDLSKISKQEQDISRFINRKWEEPQPSTPMDRLINMGFANRALNSRLLKKHNNNLPAVLEELCETSGMGFQVPPPPCEFV